MILTCTRLAGTLQTKGIPHKVMGEGQDSSGCDTAETLQREKINMPTGMQLLCLLVGSCKSQKRTGSLYHVLRGSEIVGTLTTTRRSRKCHVTLTHSLT